MSELPISAVLPNLYSALENTDQVILEAAPGAGKTTQVPLALLDSAFLQKKKILMLEPRRLAVKASAARMSSLLDEKVGKTVGYRMRMNRKISPQTRIEIVTEGILVRMLQNDPSLEEYGLVIFDEFHERSLDADLGLALTLEAREIFRDEQPLKVLIMSATLEGNRIAKLLDDAPVIRSEGRTFPVQVHYCGSPKPGEWLEQKTVRTIEQALDEQAGSILCFLPGQKEIRQTAALLEDTIAGTDSNILIAPLYGDLKLEQQQRAISEAPEGKRKVVLATNIAETSLTIQGISTVVDSGLERESRYDPKTAMQRLHTRKISKASATQRAGRAGRLAPGHCYRIWSESQQANLMPHAPPEIKQADLTALMLQIICWGSPSPDQLKWLDRPPEGACQQALSLLEKLGAVDDSKSATQYGQLMAQLPLHPRLSHMLIKAYELGLEKTAAQIASLLMEKDPFKHHGCDINDRLDWLNSRASHSKAAWQRLDQLSRQLLKTCQKLNLQSQAAVNIPEQQIAGLLLAYAYPDRIASAKGNQSLQYKLSNGRSVFFREQDSLAKSAWLSIAAVQGHQGNTSDVITLAAKLSQTVITDYLSEQIKTEDNIEWDEQADRLIAERQQKIGALIITREPVSAPSEDLLQKAIIAQIRKRGISCLPWTDELRAWQQRVLFLRAHDNGGGNWPDISDQGLLDTLESWLAPYLTSITQLNHLKKLDIASILKARLPWPLPQTLEQLAPERYQVPSGSRIRIDYAASPPVLAVKLQEMFGCTQTPTVAHNVPLQIHLLSPAKRPLQVTQDLVSFWSNGYKDVQKDMKGRYPKHPWPDDPLTALPTAKTKRHTSNT